VNEVNLPWFRSTFHRFEVTVYHDNDKVCFSKHTYQRNHLVAKNNPRTNSKERDETCVPQTIEMLEKREGGQDEHDQADPNTARQSPIRKVCVGGEYVVVYGSYDVGH